MRNRLPGFAGLLLGMAAGVVMQTFVATAMPAVVSELGGMAIYSWAFTANMLAATIAVPALGKLSDLIGRRPVYLAGIAVFLVSSGLAATVGSMWQLVLWRFGQGLGTGAVSTVVLAVVGDMFTVRQRGPMFGLIGATQVLGNLAGPLLGGWVTATLGWRWGFVLIAPVALLAGLVAAKVLPPGRLTGGGSWWKGFDVVGAAGIGMALSLLLVGLQVARSESLIRWAGAGLVMLAGWLLVRVIRLEASHPDPILPVSWLTHPAISRSAMGAFLVGAAQYGAITFVPLFVQSARGGSTADSAMILGPMVIMGGAASGIGGWLTTRVPYRWLHAVGWPLTGLGFWWLAKLGASGGQWAVMTASGLVGLGVGLFMPSLLAAAQEAADESRRAAAGAMVQVARNLGGAVGVCLLGLWLPQRDGVPALASLNGVFYTLAIGMLLGVVVGWNVRMSEQRAGSL